MSTAPVGRAEARQPSVRLQRGLLATGAAGALVFVVGAFVAPDRAWASLLVAGAWVLALALGPMFFLAVQGVSRARWSTALRRVPEAMAQALPLAAAILLLVLVGAGHVYDWADPAVVRSDELLQHKAAWLNLPFFAARAVVCFAIWILFAGAFRRRSLRQDRASDPGQAGSFAGLSAAFLVLFALTLSVASWDWLMSVEPHWFSTIFAVYHFAGVFTAGLSGIIVLAIWLRRAGPFRDVLRDDHLHDLGKLLLGFCTFWAYIWFCQYMLAWFTNLGEETGFWVERLRGGWLPLAFVNVALNWLVPFVVLLPRPAKRSEKVMLVAACTVLVGHWLDLYLLVLPTRMAAGPSLHVWEIGPPLGAVALFAWWTLRAFARAPAVPAGDATLPESLDYDA